MRLLLLAPLLCGGVRVVERRRLLGTAAAAWPAAAGAAPAWLADVPTESASEALAPPRPREMPRAPAASSRESDRVVAAQKAALAAEPRPSRAVTATLRLSVRVARADGTFSVRDDDPDPPVFGDLDLGLYGDARGSKRERKGSYLGCFPLVSADFLDERSSLGTVSKRGCFFLERARAEHSR